MLMFILGVAAGVFADRMYPTPVSAVVSWISTTWYKLTNSSKTPPP